jgi:hypothetical protein
VSGRRDAAILGVREGNKDVGGKTGRGLSGGGGGEGKKGGRTA